MQEAPGIQYSRWNNRNQDEASVNTTNTEASTWRRVNNLLCSGNIALKVAGGLALFWVIFIIGYVTGYYVHKC